MDESDMKKKLSPEQYEVMHNKGTEAPFTGKYLHEKSKGVYACAVCGTSLFSSDTKFDSGSGWPSFSDVVKEGNVRLVTDTSHGMERTEVVCATCNSHLGHMFLDGPQETTGKRYCINSVCLDLKKSDE